MKQRDIIKKLQDSGIRILWNAENENWYLVLMDVIRVLAESSNPKAYWQALKKRLEREGNCNLQQVQKMTVVKENGRKGRMAVIDLGQFFRLIQAFRSPRAEVVKRWLAQAGEERIKEAYDPERGLDRALDNWRKMGRDEKWILQRMMSQETRHRLTEYWGSHGITASDEFRTLTNLVHKAWSDMTVQEHKALKGLKSQNLRDHMTEAELIFMALAEMTVRQIAENKKAKGLEQNALSAVKGGEITRNARCELEKETSEKVLSDKNFLMKRNVRKTEE